MTIRYPTDRLRRELGPARLEHGVRLAPFTTFRIGGRADLFFRARTTDDLVLAVSIAREEGVPYFLLGMGANILVGDLGFRGLVIRNETASVTWLDETRVRCASGVRVFPDLIDATVARGLGGLHHFVGIPSSVGGAIWQNLHFLSPAPERERTMFVEEVVESCEILSQEGDRRTVNREYFEFGYDYSILHDRDDIALSVTFALRPEDPETLRRVVRENLEWRDARHPDLWLYPCAGSIFQKIEGIGAGRLIDECGLKGRVHGGAQIFHKHANIIVNLGNASADEVVWLMRLARDTVHRELGHELKPEIGLIGEFINPFE
ncbi:MAG TPA: UDP-N-acetylmuramate dehydrogenase [Longimicrobiales bacterium]|nr:UDP-N-acetylmuramate dehydrogenase [Longimicrobiales bacterium]